MSDREILDLIRAQIEEPAFARMQALMMSGQLDFQDAAMFRASADRYKAAMLAEYEGYDPRIRNELLKSLMVDYRTELDRLIEVAVRHKPAPLPTEPRAVASPAPPEQAQPRGGGNDLRQWVSRMSGRIPWKWRRHSRS